MIRECQCGSDELNDCHCGAKETKLEPVEVRGRITHTVRTKNVAAEHASYTSFTFTGTGDVPIKILGFDPLRKRAVVDTQGASVYLGSERQIRSGVTGNGFTLTQNMNALTLENQEELWCMAVQGAGTATVSVLNERYSDEAS